MATRHHPDDTTLLSYAAGTLPSNASAIVASHIDVCTGCANQNALLEDLGVALLDALPAAKLAGQPPAMALLRLEADVSSADCVDDRKQSGAAVPTPLAQFIGDDLSEGPWERISVGRWQRELDVTKMGRGSLRLVKLAASKHLALSFAGQGLVLILCGELSTNKTRYGRGDVVDTQSAAHIRVRSGPDEPCICLIAGEKASVLRNGVMAKVMSVLR